MPKTFRTKISAVAPCLPLRILPPPQRFLPPPQRFRRRMPKPTCSPGTTTTPALGKTPLKPSLPRLT